MTDASRTSKTVGEIEFPCGHTVAHEEGCPRCEVKRLRYQNNEMRNQARIATELAVENAWLRAALTENDRLRATIIRARAAMHSATVFVTSRERIKRPGGEQWWRDELAAVDAAWDGIPDETEKSDG